MSFTASFVGVALVLAGAGYGVFRQQFGDIRRERCNDLRAIAQLKSGQISAWRQERLANARVHASGLVRAEVMRWMKAPDDPAPLAAARSRLETLRGTYGYQNLIVAAPDGRLLVTLDPHLSGLEAETCRLVVETAAGTEARFGDLFRCPDCGRVHLDVAAPILDDAQQPLAVLLLRSDPDQVLYPLVQSWPTPSASAETLLVRRNGDHVLFLNALRHSPAPPLTVRIPTSRSDVPAVEATAGRSGIFEGRDYRGVAVVSDLRPVPDSPWFMVAKVDAREVLAEARYRGGLILLLVAVGILATGALAAYLFGRRQRGLYEQLYRAERGQRETQEEIRATFYGIGDGVIATDAQARVTRLNPVAAQLTGWREAEAVGRPLDQVFRIVDEETRSEVESPVARVLRDGAVVGLANHTMLVARDGTARPIADSGAPIRIEEGPVTGVVLVFRDQTAERAARAALQAREAFGRSVLDAVGANIAVLDRDGVITAVNAAWERFARENGDPSAGTATGVGADYLTVTRSAQGPSTEGAAEALAGIQEVLAGRSQGVAVEYPCHSPDRQRWFMLRATPLPVAEGGAVLAHIDITERRALELHRELTMRVLAMLDRGNDVHQLVGDILRLITTHTGIEAAGLRLRDGDDYPFEETNGLSAGFLERARDLCARDDAGKVLRDAAGLPVLECICGRTIRAGRGPGGACFTRKGGFWTNSVTALRAAASAEGQPAWERDCCAAEGYESVALVPLRLGDEVIGILHLHDHRRGMFTPDTVAFFEELVASIGIAVSRRWAAVAMRDALAQSEQSRRALLSMMEDEKRAEESRDRLATAVDQAAEAISITDAQGVILYVNPAFERVSGYTRQEAIGKTPRILKSGKHSAEFYRHMWETLIAGQAWTGHLTNRRKDGASYEVDASISPLRDDVGAIVNYVAVSRDITREQELEAQLWQSQKLEAIGRLAGGVAHDFNNLLMGIMGYVELCRERVPTDSPIRQWLDEIMQGAQRSADLTRQLLAFARKQTVEPRVIDLNEAVAGMLKLLRGLIGEDISLAWVPACEVWPIRVDPGQIDQILANLCINARDAVSGTGRITIETQNASIDADYCAGHAEAVSGEHVVLAVSDNGCGMDRATMERLFEPFFTTKPVGQGTGLGLATVHGIVKQNRGFISVYSEPGKGTTFRIYFPRHAQEVPAGDTPKAVEPTPGGTEVVMVAEDEKNIRAIAALFLQALGYTVLTAPSPDDALRLAAEHAGPIHLLITDVVMPGMSGRDLAARLCETKPQMRCLYISGYTANVIAHQGVLDAGVHFLAKPFTRDALARKVREVLGSQQITERDTLSARPVGSRGVISSPLPHPASQQDGAASGGPEGAS